MVVQNVATLNGTATRITDRTVGRTMDRIMDRTMDRTAARTMDGTQVVPITLPLLALRRFPM